MTLPDIPDTHSSQPTNKDIFMAKKFKTIDGCEAAAYVAFRVNETSPSR